MSMREMTYGEAVKEAIAEEMRRDPTVFFDGRRCGQSGVRFSKCSPGCTMNLAMTGVIDTPIAEAGFGGAWALAPR